MLVNATAPTPFATARLVLVGLFQITPSVVLSTTTLEPVVPTIYSVLMELLVTTAAEACASGSPASPLLTLPVTKSKISTDDSGLLPASVPAITYSFWFHAAAAALFRAVVNELANADTAGGATVVSSTSMLASGLPPASLPPIT